MTKQTRRYLPLSLLALCAPAALFGQQVAPAAAPAQEEIIELSPFNVDATDESGYQARNSLAGTSINSSLNDVAASISVITKEFLQDAGVTELETVLIYTTSTEASGIGGNFTSANTAEDPQSRTERTEARPQMNTRVRGLSAADLTRDYFVTDIALDSYNVDRVEINRGPNAALFGLGSPGGIINSGLKHANLRTNATEVGFNVSSFDSTRATVDHNQVIVKNKLAARVVGLRVDKGFQQEGSFYDDERLYSDITFRPFKNTTLRINGEWGDVKGAKPKVLPPVDRITPWFALGKPTWDASTQLWNSGLNTFVKTNGSSGYGDGSNFVIIYNQPDNSDPRAGVSTNLDGFVPLWRRSYDPDLATAPRDLGLQMLNTSNQFIIGDPAAYGITAGQARYYLPTRLMDPSIFNFYDYNLEGPNNLSTQNFRVINASLEQTFWDNRAGFELAVNQQHYRDSFLTHSSQSNTDSINIDLNKTLFNGAPNPNFGRAFAGGNGYAEGYSREREAYRLKSFVNLDIKRYTDNKILRQFGRHVLTGTLSGNTRKAENSTYMNLKTTNELWYRKGQPSNANQASGELRAGWITYLGSSLAGNTTATGANLTGVTVDQRPSYATNAMLWNPVTNTFDTGQKQGVLNFIDNPNDVWTWGRSGTKEKVKSTAFVLQSFLLSEKLVSTVSWRSDHVKQYSAGAPSNPATGLVIPPGNITYPANPAVNATESNWSFGLVGHAPDAINKFLPWDMKLSLHFNSSKNFNATAASKNIYNQPLPFPSGDTKEWGLSAENKKFSARVTFFKTEQASSTIAVPGQTVTWQQFADLYKFNTPAEIAASGFKLPTEVLAAVNWKQVGVLPNGNPEYLPTNPQQVGVRELQNYESKGIEMEFTYNPTSNWRMALNASKQESVTSKSAQDYERFVASMMPIWKDPKIGGALYARDRGADNNPKNLYGAVVEESLITNLANVQARDGGVVGEERKWRINFLNNYEFSKSSKLSGFSVGSGVRWQDKVAIGFPVIEKSPGRWLPDVANPYYGDSEIRFDAWVGYGRKFNNNKIDWSVKLRLRNIGIGDELIASRANPDGSIAEARITESQTWELANTIRF